MTTSQADILRRLDCGPVRFHGDENALYERHLVFDNVIDPERAHLRQKFESLSRSIRDLLTQRWIKTRAVHNVSNPKRVYYLSMEFLIGRSLMNNIINLAAEPIIRDLMQAEGLDLLKLAEQEPDAGLGNG